MSDKTSALKAHIAELEAECDRLWKALTEAVDAWDTHNDTDDMMQGHWVREARAALRDGGGE